MAIDPLAAALVTGDREAEVEFMTNPYFKDAITILAKLLHPMVHGLAVDCRDNRPRMEDMIMATTYRAMVIPLGPEAGA